MKGLVKKSETNIHKKEHQAILMKHVESSPSIHFG